MYLLNKTSKRLALLALTIVAALSTSAATNEFEAELDSVYTLPQGETYYFSFTAPYDDVYVLLANIYAPRPFTDADCTETATYSFSYGGEYGQMVEFSMTAGTTYYFKSSTYGPYSDVTMKIIRSGSEGLALESVSQEEGAELDINDNAGLLTLTFNMNVRLSSAIIQSGVQSSALDPHVSGVYISFELREIVYEWLNSGLVSAGDKITLTLYGICASSDSTIIYGDDGTLTLTYIASEIPTQVVTSFVPETLLSYYIPGNEEGIAYWVFDAPLATGDAQTATATLTFGSAEEDDSYTEEMELSVADSTLILDFTGKLRTKAAMGISGTYTSFSLKVAAIKDAEGKLVYSSGQGTTGSFSYSLTFEEISSDITAEFTPGNKESIADVDEIEIWLSDRTAVVYDGVLFESGDSLSIIVPTSECTVTNDGVGNGVAIVAPVPAAAKTADDVTVSLANVVYVDGIDHDISVLYNYVPKLVVDFSPENISPEGNTRKYVASVSAVVLTFSETAYINDSIENAFTFTDTSDNSIITATAKNSAKDDKIVGITPASALEDGHNYTLTIAQGAIGDEEYNETGHIFGHCNAELTQTYMVNKTFAGAQFITDPLDGATVNSLFEIKIYCDDIQGPIYNDDFGIYLFNEVGDTIATGSLEDIPSVAGEQVITLSEKVSTNGTYTLEVQDSVFYIGTGSNIEANSAATFTYTVEYNNSDITLLSIDPENESTVYLDQDNVWTLVFSGAVNINDETTYVVYGQGITFPFATITATGADATDVNGVTYSSEWQLTAYSSILSMFEGDYVTFCIVAEDESGQRVLGNEGDLDYTYFRFEYIVEDTESSGEVVLGSSHGDNWVTNPAEFSTLTSLSRIAITDGQGVSMAPTYWGTGYLPLILNAAGDTIRTIGNNDMTSSEYDWENWCGADSVIVTFDAITEPGTYYLYVPEKAFTNDNFEYCETMTFVYYIGSEESGISAITADGASRVEYFDVNGRRVATPGKGVYIIRITGADGVVTSRQQLFQ